MLRPPRRGNALEDSNGERRMRGITWGFDRGNALSHRGEAAALDNSRSIGARPPPALIPSQPRLPRSEGKNLVPAVNFEGDRIQDLKRDPPDDYLLGVNQNSSFGAPELINNKDISLLL